VVGAVALEATLAELGRIGWDTIGTREELLNRRLRRGLDAIDGVRVLGPGAGTETLAVASFVVEGVHHALVAARLSAEWGIGVRHGCFCAHPYLIRLLGLPADEVSAYRDRVRRGDHREVPGAVRASCSLATTAGEVDRLLDAVRAVAAGADAGTPPPVPYEQDPATGDFWPVSDRPGWRAADRGHGSACAMG
jgi:selenocysteine lyase/cysteine desulfurase